MTYVYRSLMTSHENDDSPVVSTEEPSYQIDDFADDASNSLSWESEDDTDNVHDQNLESDTDDYPQQPESDRVKESTKQPDSDKDYAYPTKRTPGRENEYTIKPGTGKDNESTNQPELDKVTAYTKQPKTEANNEFTTKRESDKKTDKITKQTRSDEVTAYTKQPKAEANKEYTPKRESEKETDNLYTKKAGPEVELNKEGIDKQDSNNDSAYTQQPDSDKNSSTTQGQESTTTSAQPEQDETSPKSFQQEIGTNNGSESQTHDDNMKTLLWYDTHEKSMRGHTTSMGFSTCEYKNCQYKSYLSRTDPKPTKPFDADAILIQSAGIWDLSPPPRRDENQVFVLAVRDSFPRTTAARDPGMGMKWVDMFNWTMTYRLDSDFVFKYANIIERENKSENAHKNYSRIFDEKEDKAVWLVSHCKTNSMREHYVREMQKVMGVDIFGGCGVEPPCPKKSKNISECIEKTALKYKYYLAFENTLVEDYVTEKVFRWFNKDIIVVVRGGSNYSRILPPGTVVDAGDFKSPTELGKYLKELAQNKKRYTEYLKRKDNYYSTGKLVPAQEANCKLCEYLNNLDAHRKSYNNIMKWWLKNWRNYDMQPSPLKGWPINRV